MIIDANSEACCSNDVTKDKEIDWKTLTEAELKVTLGRLVDKVKDGQELRVSFMVLFNYRNKTFRKNLVLQ